MSTTRKAPEKLTDAREWLDTQPRPDGFDHAIDRLLDGLAMLYDLREIVEEQATVVECADLYDVLPSEIDTARQHLALHHRIVDSVVYELAGYMPGSTTVPEWLDPLRSVLYRVLTTEKLGYAIHAHDAFHRVTNGEVSS